MSNSFQFITGLGLGIGLSYICHRFIIDKNSSKDCLKNTTADFDEDSDWDDISSTEEDEDEEQYKMVLAVRMDLKMGKGKIAAQCSHAAVAAFKTAKNRKPELCSSWEKQGSRKIAGKIY